LIQKDFNLHSPIGTGLALLELKGELRQTVYKILFSQIQRGLDGDDK